MKRKYKVMLVDDEQDVMDVIRKKINWEEIGLEEPVYASNGLEALEKAEDLHPDIVMTDIKMPYMNGLELAEQLKNNFPNVRIIILSGFDEFEYAKEAVRLSAQEYLLKPIDAAHLKEVFLRIRQKLDEEMDERQNMAMLEEYYAQTLPALRENLLASLTQGKIPAEEAAKYLNDYQIQMPGPYYAVSIFHTSKNHIPAGMNYMLLMMSVQKLATDRISSKWSPCFFNYLGNLCMIASFGSPDDMTAFTDETDRFCRLCRSLLQAVVTCGIGQVCSSVYEFPASYNGARQAVSYRVIYGTSRSINIAEIAPGEGEETDRFSETELREVLKMVKLEDEQELVQAVQTYLKHNLPQSSIVAHNLFIMDLAGQLGRFARNNELDTREIFGSDNPAAMDLQEKDSEALTSWMIDICVRMQKMLQKKRADTTKDFVTKAKEYVLEHYSDTELSMNSLCSELGVSVSYFSTVFKKETGQSFVNFLTEVRMNKAADLLIEKNEKAYIVAQKVGYSDPNYFSYVFRRQFGVSPSKYKAGK